MLPYEANVQAEIAHTYATQLKAMHALHDAVTSMLLTRGWDIPKAKRRGLRPPVVRTMAMLLTKACKTFRATHLLAERGLMQDANVQVRVLMETAVAALLILQKQSLKRNHIFYTYSISQQLKMLEEWQRTPGLKRRAPKAIVQRTRQLLDSMASKLPAGTNYTGHWSGEGNFQNAVKKLGNDVAYSAFYRSASSSAHVADTGAHVEMDANDRPVFLLPPDSKGFEATTYSARELLWAMANRINLRLGLGFDTALTPHKLTRAQIMTGVV
jgi:hypothetical protein